MSCPNGKRNSKAASKLHEALIVKCLETLFTASHLIAERKSHKSVQLTAFLLRRPLDNLHVHFIMIIALTETLSCHVSWIFSSALSKHFSLVYAKIENESLKQKNLQKINKKWVNRRSVGSTPWNISSALPDLIIIRFGYESHKGC